MFFPLMVLNLTSLHTPQSTPFFSLLPFCSTTWHNFEKFCFLQVLQEANEKISSQQKELKEAQNQRKLAMAEFSELNDKLADMRSQKTKLSRTVREKEEELGMGLKNFEPSLLNIREFFLILIFSSFHVSESSLQKLDSLRLEVRNADRKRREVQ